MQPDRRAPLLRGYALQAQGCRLYADGGELDGAGRKELLRRARAGEPVELEFEAITFLQGDEPNRNFLRFKPGILRTLARTFEGAPFLRNHDQGDVLARGGTVISSRAVREGVGDAARDDADGARWVFHQRIRAVKPWAVEGLLDGTIDRFSIGWHPSGPILYRHSGKEIEDWPAHWPGEELDDGTVVEWVFTAAEGTEVSGVNVPAVLETGVEGIRAGLQAAVALSRGMGPQRNNEMKRIATKLGLAESSDEDSVLAAVGRLLEERAGLEGRLAAVEEARTLLAAKVSALESTRAAAEQAALEVHVSKRIAELKAVGALPILRDGAGAALEGKQEAHLRALAAKGGREAFDAAAADFVPGMFSVVGAPSQLRTAPAPTGIVATGDAEVQAFLKSPEMQAALLSAGVAEEDVIKSGGVAKLRLNQGRN